MAEATLAAETEVTPSEEVAVVTPEAPAVSEPAPENVEDSSVIDALLESIETAGKGNADVNGTKATPDEVVPPAPAAPTPEQIEARVRARVTEENRLKGLKQVAMETGPAALQKFRDRLDSDEQREWDYIINQMKGAVQPLADLAVDVDANLVPQVKQTAYKEAEDFTFGHLAEIAKKELGEDAAKALLDNRSKYQSWQDPFSELIKLAQKGMVPAADYVSKASTKEHLDKIEKSLNDRGASGVVTRSLKDITGNGGSDLPPIRGGTTRQGTVEWATEAPISELLADKARRAATG